MGQTISDALGGANISGSGGGCYAYFCAGVNKTILANGRHYTALEVGVNSKPTPIYLGGDGTVMVKVGSFK